MDREPFETVIKRLPQGVRYVGMSGKVGMAGKFNSNRPINFIAGKFFILIYIKLMEIKFAT
jgi:hypothetical protein